MEDILFAIWPVTLCAQAVQCLSIVSFCFLYLKPLFEALDTGFIRTDELRRKGQHNQEGSYNLSTLRSAEHIQAVQTLATLTEGNNDITITGGSDAEWDGRSQDSKARIIREVRTWAVESSESSRK